MPRIQPLPAFIMILLATFQLSVLAAPSKPNIAWMPSQFNAPSSQTVTWNMWWGENGTDWTLYNNGSPVCSGSLTPNGQNAQSASCQIALAIGSNNLSVELCNRDGCQSDSKNIQVAGNNTTTAVPPAQPTIAWMPASASADDQTIRWDMWWGNNGNNWRLLHNGKKIHSGNLTPNGQQAQNGETVVNLQAGQHTFIVELCSNNLCTASESKTINIADTSLPPNPGPAPPPVPLPTGLGEYNVAYKNTSGKIVGSYFVEWGIYDRNYHVADIPAQNLTHLLYAFIAICGDNQSAPAGARSAISQECAGQPDDTITIVDRFAALEKSYPGDPLDASVYGNFGQLIRLKAANPNLSILPSIGGWTLSDSFFDLANDPARRTTFVQSSIDFLRTYSFFDGIDIDWEYPGGEGANPAKGSAQDRQGYADLMTELRAALDALELETGRNYQLTSAVGIGPGKIDNVNYVQAGQAVDYFFAMTYDFYGAWNNVLGHHAGLYPTDNSKLDGFSVDEGIQNLINAGVPAEKLVVGAAMYGRGWKGVSGGSFNPMTGTGNGAADGTWEAGLLDYRDIEQNYLGGGQGINGFIYAYDDAAQAPYVWNPFSGELITYDNQRSVKAKGQYVRDNGLAGLFSWEIDADNGRILNAMNAGLGHQAQQDEPNPMDESGNGDANTGNTGNTGDTYTGNQDNGTGGTNAGFSELLTRSQFEQMFPHRNELFSYDVLKSAAGYYDRFLNEGTSEQRKRELAAFLANISHETTGGWGSYDLGSARYTWGLHFIEEIGCESGACTGYCDANNPSYGSYCSTGNTYHGRGPMQLSWNYNYGLMGDMLNIDLLGNPSLLTTDGVLSFRSAIWFWMTTQSPKPSNHDVMTGQWTPSADDISKGRLPGFGMTINVINGALECNQPHNSKTKDRIGYYQTFTQILGVTPGENLQCDSMQSYY